MTTENAFQKLLQFFLLPKIQRAEKKIGYKLVFHNLPERFIDGWVSWDETATWKKFGLNIDTGLNYWTIGKPDHGVSARYDRNAPEYQSWLGGYLIKLASGQPWTKEDHFKLAIADQNSWLRTDGDPKPLTTTEGWDFISDGPITIGEYSGTLHEFGCTTHADMDNDYRAMRLRLESFGMAALMNASNPNLRIQGRALVPHSSDNAYELIKLRGYIAIFDIEKDIKLVLYGNGAMVKNGDVETDAFITLKDDLLKAMQSSEVVRINHTTSAW